MKMTTRILIIEDDEHLAAAFQRLLSGAGYGADLADDVAGGKELLLNGSYGAIFMDINLRGKQTGMDLLRELRNNEITTPVVIVTGSPEVATAAEAVRNGAFDYICKPIEKEHLLRIAEAAVKHKRKSDEKERYQKNLETAFRSVRDTMVSLDIDKTMSDRDEAVDGLTTVARQAAQNPSRVLPSTALNPENLLSEREQRILTMLGQGETNSDIAAAFGIGLRTVETYYARIMEKLDLDGMKELRRYAIRNTQK
jgi:FixJ family two-component response regulator